jgi:hypothetical protein
VGSGRGAHEGESSLPLCGRSPDRTRARSPRQLPTDHDYAARPANIRLINRRDSFLDRYPRGFRPEEEKTALVVDRSFHIRGGACSARRSNTMEARVPRPRACQGAIPQFAEKRDSLSSRTPFRGEGSAFDLSRHAFTARGKNRPRRHSEERVNEESPFLFDNDARGNPQPAPSLRKADLD